MPNLNAENLLNDSKDGELVQMKIQSPLRLRNFIAMNHLTSHSTKKNANEIINTFLNLLGIPFTNFQFNVKDFYEKPITIVTVRTGKPNDYFFMAIGSVSFMRCYGDIDCFVPASRISPDKLKELSPSAPEELKTSVNTKTSVFSLFKSKPNKPLQLEPASSLLRK